MAILDSDARGDYAIARLVMYRERDSAVLSCAWRRHHCIIIGLVIDSGERQQAENALGTHLVGLQRNNMPGV